MATAEIITIGTELLLGETVDTNTRHIARRFREVGLDIYRTSTVGDNSERIARIIKEGMTRAQIIITTGGLGPTVDDPTREAIAEAFEVKTEYQPELWEQIKDRFRRFNREPTENNKRQAFIPKGALPIENPVGTAPAFIMESGEHAVIALPGVPREMEYLLENAILPYLRERYQLTSVIKTRLLRTAGVGESQIDDKIADLERLTNPTVGLAAHAGQVDIRIAAKAESNPEADEMIAKVEMELRERLGKWVYGVDEDTLEDVALETIQKNSWELIVLEAGLGGRLIKRLASANGPFLRGELLKGLPSQEELISNAKALQSGSSTLVVLGAVLKSNGDQQNLKLVIVTPVEEKSVERSFGGPPQLAALWATNLCLNWVRRICYSEKDG